MIDMTVPPPFQPPGPPRAGEQGEAPGISGVLAFQVGIAAVVGLYFASEVLIPITLAILLVPVVQALRRLLPRVRPSCWPWRSRWAPSWPSAA